MADRSFKNPLTARSGSQRVFAKISWQRLGLLLPRISENQGQFLSSGIADWLVEFQTSVGCEVIQRLIVKLGHLSTVFKKQTGTGGKGFWQITVTAQKTIGSFTCRIDPLKFAGFAAGLLNPSNEKELYSLITWRTLEKSMEVNYGRIQVKTFIAGVCIRFGNASVHHRL